MWHINMSPVMWQADVANWRLVVAAMMLIEIFIEVFGLGRLFFDDGFNTLDLSLVVVAFIVASMGVGDGSEDFHSANVWSRVFRALGVLPIVRLLSFIEPLAKLACAFAYSSIKVSTLMVMCVMMIYLFAVICKEVIGNDPAYINDEDIQGQYGTVIDAMWTLTVENLELPGNSKDAEEIEFLWIYFFLFYAIMMVGIFNMAIGLLAAGLEEAEAADNAAADLDDKIFEEELRMQLAQIMATMPSADKEDLNWDDEDKLVSVDALQTFLEGAMVEGSVLAKALEDSNVKQSYVMRALDYLPAIMGTGNNMSSDRFLKEVFDLEDPCLRVDVLEIMAECRRGLALLHQLASRGTDEHVRRHDEHVVQMKKEMDVEKQKLQAQIDSLNKEVRARNDTIEFLEKRVMQSLVELCKVQPVDKSFLANLTTCSNRGRHLSPDDLPPMASDINNTQSTRPSLDL